VVNFGCIPQITNQNGGNCSSLAADMAATFGASYKMLLDTLRADVSDATFLLLDVWNATTVSASKPSPLGKAERLVDGLD
jgi:hypothetical protein